MLLSSGDRWLKKECADSTSTSSTGPHMNVTSTSGAAGAYPTQATQRPPESAEVKRAGGDNDGDGDDAGAPKTAQARQPAQPQVSKPTATMGNNVNTVA
jgi:hypothetical protein